MTGCYVDREGGRGAAKREEESGRSRSEKRGSEGGDEWEKPTNQLSRREIRAV